MIQSRSWLMMARVLLLALAVAAAPVPVLAAGDSPTPPGAPVLKDAIAKVAATEVAASARAQKSSGATADKSELGSTSFFKKPAGIIALVVVAAGGAYMAYSMKHNRIHSVVRAGQ